MHLRLQDCLSELSATAEHTYDQRTRELCRTLYAALTTLSSELDDARKRLTLLESRDER